MSSSNMMCKIHGMFLYLIVLCYAFLQGEAMDHLQEEATQQNRQWGGNLKEKGLTILL